MMERKRKLPPRAAARKDDAAVAVKKRNVTARPPSPTPAVLQSPPREPTPSPPPPQPPSPLPKSIEVGKPLPTVEEPQLVDLSSNEYQSLAESGVLSESITRSRQNWISEGLFEKFWTKPHKRKGVLQEDPNNPPKDSMTKVGAVVITLEPHIVEATMFTVKTSKLPPQLLQKFHPKQQPPQPTTQQGPSSRSEAISPAQTPNQPSGEQSLSLSRTNEQTSAQAQSKASPQPPLARPVIQYGPPSGSMPPLAVSHATTAAPNTINQSSASASSSAATPATTSPATAASSVMIAPAPAGSNMSNAPHMTSPAPAHSAGNPLSTNSSAAVQSPAKTQTSPRPVPVVKLQASPAPATKSPRTSPEGSQPKTAPSASTASGVVSKSTPQAVPSPPVSTPRPVGRPPSNLPPPRQGVAPAPVGNQASNAVPHSAGAASSQSRAPSVTKTHTPGTPAAAAVKPAANDPVIALLAQKASRDPGLRDLMKRVAVGEAKDGELNKFQKIIDQLNAEYRQRGGQQGPSADRLLVDGRTVKYFADEVRTILDIVLASNPNQKSSELRPPRGSDPLVVLLVKTALEDQRTRDMINRIAEGKPGFTDATDLKQILDRLHRDAKITPKGTPTPAHAIQSRQPVATGPTKTMAQHNMQQVNAQALKSKGPPPANRPDISAVVFDFGMGDRFLFPKFSILEFLPTQSGQQVVASFLIVRKGSTSEYGADPKLDYYQPVTIRLQTSGGRQLENLARVVAPQDEVRRYMDGIMDNMTRAEYILLAMRLPRADFDPDEVESIVEGSKTSSSTPKSESEREQTPTLKPGVLWARGSGAKHKEPVLSPKLQDPEQEAQSKYERLIRAVAEKEEANL